MANKVKLPRTLLEFVTARPGARWQAIRSEASRRRFYRLRLGKTSIVAMVYPEPAPGDVERFLAVHDLFRKSGLRVPRIHDVLDDQVVLQEDAGDLLLQKAWRQGGAGQRLRLLNECREILRKLAAVPPGLAVSRLDQARQKWEMDFFLSHFFPRFRVRPWRADDLRVELQRLVETLAPADTFAHRDFHSRNLLVLGREIVIVDFQDSLLAPRYYDLVSLAFDSYLDLGMSRGRLFLNLAASSDDRELRQVRLTALQRNIKALGTFAYQTYANNHPAYARYIPRTLRHVQSHLQVLRDPELQVLSRYFSSVTRNA